MSVKLMVNVMMYGDLKHYLLKWEQFKGNNYDTDINYILLAQETV